MYNCDQKESPSQYSIRSDHSDVVHEGEVDTCFKDIYN